MIHWDSALTIIGMGITTYLTRIGGYLLLGGKRLSPRATAMMDIIPGCVLISVLAPSFASGRPTDLAGLAITVFAATRWALLPTMAIGIVSTGVLRAVFP
ncbi:AzlD family protein [Neokomagataea anthophila]|uniref:AzlD family protein n=1 Tax=Neokomagataea anthophila TaxID=2826925 RepID=A0ABS5E3X5_9PROT|nr:AzlD family protein [Neokomagataea anthophila]MBR0558607.1 AzlD family protein [Neokomagataea anthophila]